MTVPDPMEIRNRIENYTEERDLQMLFKAVYLLGAKQCEMLGQKYDCEPKTHAYGPTGVDSWEETVLVDNLPINTICFKIRTARTFRKGGERIVLLPSDCEPWARQLLDYFKQKGNSPVFPFYRQDIYNMVKKSRVLKGLTKNVPLHTQIGLDDLRWYRKEELENKYGFKDAHLKAYGIIRIDPRETPDKQLDDSKIEELKKEYLRLLCNPKTEEKNNNILFVDEMRIDVEDLIEKHETEKTELKSSLCYDYDKKNKYWVPEMAVAKAVASFLNSDGGFVLIGVRDDKTILGLEKDFEAIHNTTEDAFKLHFTSVVGNYIGLENTPYVKIRFAKKEGKKIVVVVIPKKAPKEVFLTENKTPRFYIRSGNSSRELNVKEAVEYIRQHWEAPAVPSKKEQEFKTNDSELIEKIYGPLSSILEKHAKEVQAFGFISAHEVDEILEKETYYKMQMPQDLLERLDNYTDQVEALNRKEHQARTVMIDILNRVTCEFLKKPYSPSDDSLKLESRAISKRGNQLFLHPQDIFKLLLENRKIENFLEKTYWYDIYERISIKYLNEQPVELGWAEFNERIWDKCLAEVSANPKVMLFKESNESLLGEIWDIIEEVTSS